MVVSGKYDELVEEFEADVERDGASRASILAEIKSVVSQMRMLSVGKSDSKVKNKVYFSGGRERNVVLFFRNI